ncbi:arsenical resistance operon trans-acting repressor ArsD [Clostridium aceticum]|uniref:Arsenical resistance operon trans-acting repressor ArsD n=1 Tax=Clostridium aceticum TaxID=84022 RepID=A0A0D8I9L4_9CLOT|nr:arsenite efflux transporter metallochaperone ArsD [Clostridium aceticum]AKL95714.1 arsenical resistance operon trans-acting repressor ArsD [Clostridium aceticum]KJF26732.1 arsenic resistance operon repressor [Clostridium aceticum]
MKIEIYDPPMCCPTGICGPSVDETLVKTKENLELLKKKYPEAIVERYMISQQPSKFKENEAVFQLIKEKGRDVLPITTVNGIIIKSSQYPTLEEIESHL